MRSEYMVSSDVSEGEGEGLPWVSDVAEIVSLSSCHNSGGVSAVEVTIEVCSELVEVTDILLVCCVPESAWHFLNFCDWVGVSTQGLVL